MAGIVNTHYMYCRKKAALKFTYTGRYNQRDDGVVELLTSGTLVFLDPAVIDIFCVGGGGAGDSGESAGGTNRYPGGGGAGGYTNTVKNRNVSGSINVTIGAGGQSARANGMATSFGDITANGGGGGTNKTSGSNYRLGNGGNGGSGGGGAVQSNSDYGAGGSDGDDGENGYPSVTISGYHGTGQGATTREFGEAAGKLYAGGGGGGRYMAAQSPVISAGGSGGGGAGGWAGSGISEYQAASAGGANTGGGGGGGVYHYANGWRSAFGTGGSGIVCFRAAMQS